MAAHDIAFEAFETAVGAVDMGLGYFSVHAECNDGCYCRQYRFLHLTVIFRVSRSLTVTM